MTKRFTGASMAGTLGVLAMASWVGLGTAGAQGVTAALTPASLTVAPGAEFELELRVTQAGHVFNAFKAIVGYDTAALSLVPLSPTTLQQGTLMTGACQTFHRFGAGAGVDTLESSLLCSGVSLTGPGQIYRLRFRASNTPQTTTVRIVPGPRTQFIDGGLFVPQVTWTDASIGIGMPPAAVGDAVMPAALSLAVVPNPSHGSVVFAIGQGGSDSGSLTVRDVQGRVVRKLVPSGRQVAWDGRHELGQPVPNGTYFATLEVGGRSTTIRFSLIH